MTETTVEMTAVPIPDSADEREKSKEARILEAGPEGGEVVILQAGDMYGKVGTLTSIDQYDPRLTFLVEYDPGQTRWVYAVKPTSGMDSLALRDAEIARLRQKVSAAEAALEQFKETVREVAIRVAEEQSWCDDGLNGVLEELGLPKKNTRWVKTATVEITVRWDGTADDGADIRVDSDGQVLFPGSTRNDEIEIESVSWSEPEEDE